MTPLTSQHLRLITSVLGKPYALPPDPPNSYDCLALVQMLRREIFSRPTPVVPGDTESSLNYYCELGYPVEGCVVRLAPMHLGMWCQGQVLTTLVKEGVVAPTIHVAQRLWPDLSYWEYIDRAILERPAQWVN